MTQNISDRGAPSQDAERQSDEQGSAIDALSNVQRLMLMTPHVQATVMKALLAQQSEIISFLGRRCEQDIKLVEQIGAAGTVTDMISACLGFCRDAAHDYAEEAGKVTDIGSDIAVLTVVSIQQEAQAAAVGAVRAEAA